MLLVENESLDRHEDPPDEQLNDVAVVAVVMATLAAGISDHAWLIAKDLRQLPMPALQSPLCDRSPLASRVRCAAICAARH